MRVQRLEHRPLAIASDTPRAAALYAYIDMLAPPKGALDVYAVGKPLELAWLATFTRSHPDASAGRRHASPKGAARLSERADGGDPSSAC